MQEDPWMEVDCCYERVTQVDKNCSNQRNLHHLDANLISYYHQHYFCHPHPHHQDIMQEEQLMEVDYYCESDRVSVGDLPPCLTLPLRQLTNAMIFIILATKNRILISYIKLLLSYLPPCLTVYLLHLTIEMIFIFLSPKKRYQYLGRIFWWEL